MIRNVFLLFFIATLLTSCQPAVPIKSNFNQIPPELAVEYLNSISIDCDFREKRTNRIDNDKLKFITQIDIFGDYWVIIKKLNSSNRGSWGTVCNLKDFHKDKEEWAKAGTGLVSIGIICGNCDSGSI